MTNESEYWIPQEDWEVIVRNVPLVSVDLIIQLNDGLVLGKRRNQPLKGEWFVPGGSIYKNEKLTEAVHRVAQEEVGTKVTIRRRLGTYEQFYEHSDTATETGKHYIATAFVVQPDREEITATDDQHTELKVFSPPFPDLHPYVERYVNALGLSAETDNYSSDK
jgi:colanic acid biosynthesis protein WcaH